MARRIGWDDDDDFEILNHLSSKKNQDNFELIDDDFEIVPSKSKPSLTMQINPVTKILTTDTSTSATDSNRSTDASTQLPVRYGTAAQIPHSEKSDYQSILTRQSYRPLPKNDLLELLQQPSKPKAPSFTTNKLQELVNENDQDRRSLVELAKQTQKDFLDAIQLD